MNLHSHYFDADSQLTITAQHHDILIIGAGAAGLFAGVWAGRTNPDRSIVILDGAKTLGAKILVAGGGRCNVTHHAVSEREYAGSSRNAIRNVLRQFTVENTIDFFKELGITLKREETGKLFPTTDKARTILDALLRAANDAGVTIEHPCRVEGVSRPTTDGPFFIHGSWGQVSADRLILATGGKSLPKSGSDGIGYAFAKTLGHSITERIFPSLVPLIVDPEHFIRKLSGIAVPATLSVHQSSGKKLIEFTNSTLLTHFGLSGPGALDISRYLIDARQDDPAAYLQINWLPGNTASSLDDALLQSQPNVRLSDTLKRNLPTRLFDALCQTAGVASNARRGELSKEQRRLLVLTFAELHVPITDNRGWTYAEVTAGGVPLSEIVLKSMESRVCPGLHLCGEICDVDGRIGGFNFQWAWASGFVAGSRV